MEETKGQITITRNASIAINVDTMGGLDFQGQLSATPAGLFQHSPMQITLQGTLNLTGQFARLINVGAAANAGAEEKKAISLSVGESSNAPTKPSELCKCPCDPCRFCDHMPCPKCRQDPNECICDVD